MNLTEANNANHVKTKDWNVILGVIGNKPIKGWGSLKGLKSLNESFGLEFRLKYRPKASIFDDLGRL